MPAAVAAAVDDEGHVRRDAGRTDMSHGRPAVPERRRRDLLIYRVDIGCCLFVIGVVCEVFVRCGVWVLSVTPAARQRKE